MLAGMDEPIPDLLPPDEMPPITDQATLQRTWRALMGPLGFADRQLWVLFIDDAGGVRAVTPIHEVPRRLVDEEAERLCRMLGHLEDGLSFAFLYARPGPRGRTGDDMSWARGLDRAGRRLGTRAWPVHLANDRELTVVAPDDLADAG
jgi:hypothetical protein